MTILKNLDPYIQNAINHFWYTRMSQIQKQQASGRSDAGTRGAVTGGKQMLVFEQLVVSIALERGIPESSIFFSSALELPGYFRPEKKWDLVIVDEGILVAAIEFKSQVGPSFGNNFNNRAEEAIGTANDLWIAYREGAFGLLLRPWLGYLFILEDHPKSTCSIRLQEPHFQVFPEFKGASYAKRYELLLIRLIRERYYDAGCLLLSKATTPPTTMEPCNILLAKLFFTQLAGHLDTYIMSKSI
jgi:hypothetical protein